MESYFKALDDGTGELTFVEFQEACDVLLYKFWTTPDASIFVRKYGFRFDWIRRQISSNRLENFMNWLLIVNAIFIVVESTYDIMKFPEPWFIAPLEMFFSCIYVVEVIMKL